MVWIANPEPQDPGRALTEAIHDGVSASTYWRTLMKCGAIDRLSLGRRRNDPKLANRRCLVLAGKQDLDGDDAQSRQRHSVQLKHKGGPTLGVQMKVFRSHYGGLAVRHQDAERRSVGCVWRAENSYENLDASRGCGLRYFPDDRGGCFGFGIGGNAVTEEGMAQSVSQLGFRPHRLLAAFAAACDLLVGLSAAALALPPLKSTETPQGDGSGVLHGFRFVFKFGRLASGFLDDLEGGLVEIAPAFSDHASVSHG